jgi:hypothetical protein
MARLSRLGESDEAANAALGLELTTRRSCSRYTTDTSWTEAPSGLRHLGISYELDGDERLGPMSLCIEFDDGKVG